MNIRFEAHLSDRATWQLQRMRATLPGEFAHVVECIAQLERNPYPPPALRGPLVIPGQIVYPDALRCRSWRIAFRVEDDMFVIIEDLGRWPPRPEAG